ncbi:DUF4351 domain-containing protein [Myxacorys almedinensis]|uniref:DUF4351 domain-containing protein n=1 Tax=Myxacorys almedinensis TaxID=2651157 RepID=UPI00192E83C1|nr:DUF4351 domain-containing protein [Myxacorys almedinensis]
MRCKASYAIALASSAIAISSLPLPVLEDLSEALLNFTTLADLEAWLEARCFADTARVAEQN